MLKAWLQRRRARRSHLKRHKMLMRLAREKQADKARFAAMVRALNIHGL